MPETTTGIDLASQTGQQAIATAISNLSNLRINLENVDKDWEEITSSWVQDPQTLVFLLSYNTDFCLQAVFININNSLVAVTIAKSSNYGNDPTLTYDSTTNRVTASWASTSYAKIKR